MEQKKEKEEQSKKRYEEKGNPFVHVEPTQREKEWEIVRAIAERVGRAQKNKIT